MTYVWKVEPVGTEDRYKITLEALFETHVPAPVVTVEPAYLDLRTVTFDAEGKAVVDYTITNHGLIAADNNVFEFRQHQDYEVTPLTKNIGRLAAKSSVVVPVTIRKLNTGQTAKSSSPGGLKAQEDVPEGCWIEGTDTYEYVCVGNQIQMVPVYIPTLVCPPGVPPSPPVDEPWEHITIVMPWYYEPLQCEEKCGGPDTARLETQEIPFSSHVLFPSLTRRIWPFWSPLELPSGERLAVWWVAEVGQYQLMYYKPGTGNGLNDGILAGKCAFPVGCNTASYVAGDSNQDGEPDCFLLTTWISYDYGDKDGDGNIDSKAWTYDAVAGVRTGPICKKWEDKCPLPPPHNCDQSCVGAPLSVVPRTDEGR
ncbi:MAG: hypothetical protein NTU88_10045 [Armatimonadetes bacterium]|nr:hypothetical protein [Armatimonadota bacterium]